MVVGAGVGAAVVVGAGVGAAVVVGAGVGAAVVVVAALIVVAGGDAVVCATCKRMEMALFVDFVFVHSVLK